MCSSALPVELKFFHYRFLVFVMSFSSETYFVIFFFAIYCSKLKLKFIISFYV